MSELPTRDQIADVATRLVGHYCELGEKARLNKGTLAQCAGVTRQQFANITRNSNALSLFVFLRIKTLCNRIQQGLDEGWLPAPAARGAAQDEAMRRLGCDPGGEDAKGE